MPTEAGEAPNPVRYIGKVQTFTVGADFEAYAEQLEFFFMANGVTDSKQKKAVLLNGKIVEYLQKQLKLQKLALVAR